MPLRKALVSSSSLQDNAASFVNVTAKQLNIRKLDLKSLSESTAAALGDSARCSIDEVPADQSSLNDSRSHIMSLDVAPIGGTGAVEVLQQQKVLSFNRGDLVLDPDDAIFMNIVNIVGSLDVGFALNIWYE